jgi:hypothetical protein
MAPFSSLSLIMGMRKKVRTQWKADRKVNIAARRKAKAKRLAKAAK